MSGSMIFLIQALVLIALPVAVLRFCRLKGIIPLVVVQIVVGIALGPTLFGRVAPELYRTFFNAEALAPLSGIASVAVVIFGLITGLHFDAAILRNNGRGTLLIAMANIAVPIAAGFAGGLLIFVLHQQELGPGISPIYFPIAFGICVSVAALPVLGEILREMNLLGSRIGHVALALAGINDAILYILLAVLLMVVAAETSAGLGLVATIVLTPLYLFVMVRLVRPRLGQLVTTRLHNGEVRERALVAVGVVTLASALAMEALGLSSILGAFVAGAVMPPELRKPILDRLQAPTLALLMPFFFSITGLQTLVDPSSSLFLEAFIVATVVSVAGIMSGTAIAARLMGETWSFSLGLGALLQTKGLMEIVVLKIFLDAGVLPISVFAALISMTVFSTAIAMPLAWLLLRPADRE